MAPHQLHRTQWLPTSVDEAFGFFCDPKNLQAITPPELDFQMDEPPEGAIGEGSTMGYRLRLWGVPFRWRTEIIEWRPGHSFVDTARKSPYQSWHHRHVLVPQGDQTMMLDLVDYRLPFWPLGELAHPVVRRQLERIFDYREETIAGLFGPARRPVAAQGPLRPALGRQLGGSGAR